MPGLFFRTIPILSRKRKTKQQKKKKMKKSTKFFLKSSKG
jgi:hypothetical protein